MWCLTLLQNKSVSSALLRWTFGKKDGHYISGRGDHRLQVDARNEFSVSRYFSAKVIVVNFVAYSEKWRKNKLRQFFNFFSFPFNLIFDFYQLNNIQYVSTRRDDKSCWCYPFQQPLDRSWWTMPSDAQSTWFWNATYLKDNSRKSVRCSAVPIAPMWVYVGVWWWEGQRPQRGRWPAHSKFWSSKTEFEHQ